MSIFTAAYAGRCPSCEERIHEGDEVAWTDDQVVHAVCPEPVDELKAGSVCPDCFTERSVTGACAC